MTRDALFSASFRPKTVSTYATGQKHWRDFCHFYALRLYRDIKQCYLRLYVAWRYRTSSVLGNSVQTEINGIKMLYGKKFGIKLDTSCWYGLHHDLKGFKNDPERLSIDTKPIRDKLLSQMVAHLGSNFDSLVIRSFLYLAKYFNLRCSEYAIDKLVDERTLRISNLKFLTDSYPNALQLTLNISKTNHTWRQENITVMCLCLKSGMCPFHTLRKMLAKRKNTSSSDFLFVWSDGRVLTRHDVSRCLKKLLTKCGIYDLQHYRPHSLRKGGITDLTVAGVEDSVIRRMARHSINSKCLFIYQCLSSFEVGLLAFK